LTSIIKFWKPSPFKGRQCRAEKWLINKNISILMVSFIIKTPHKIQNIIMDLWSNYYLNWIFKERDKGSQVFECVTSNINIELLLSKISSWHDSYWVLQVFNVKIIMLNLKIILWGVLIIKDTIKIEIFLLISHFSALHWRPLNGDGFHQCHVIIWFFNKHDWWSCDQVSDW
jgi:hypothetical protein